MATVRYGVFLVGELWMVSNDEHPVVCFNTRAEAVRAARRVAGESARRGQEVELHVMDIGGQLRRVEPVPAVSKTNPDVTVPAAATESHGRGPVVTGLRP